MRIVSKSSMVRGITCAESEVPEYTPPELQGKKFGEILRTVDHDAFGLAVIIFPAALHGTPSHSPVLTRQERCRSSERFESNVSSTVEGDPVGMSPPPGSVDFGVFPPDVRDLFDAAFGPKYKASVRSALGSSTNVAREIVAAMFCPRVALLPERCDRLSMVQNGTAPRHGSVPSPSL